MKNIIVNFFSESVWASDERTDAFLRDIVFRLDAYLNSDIWFFGLERFLILLRRSLWCYFYNGVMGVICGNF